MSLVEDFLNIVDVHDLYKHELVIKELKIDSDLFRFLHYQHLPYEQKPKIESAIFGAGALRKMVVLNIFPIQRKKNKEPKFADIILVITKVKKKLQQPRLFTIEKARTVLGKRYFKIDGVITLRKKIAKSQIQYTEDGEILNYVPYKGEK